MKAKSKMTREKLGEVARITIRCEPETESINATANARPILAYDAGRRAVRVTADTITDAQCKVSGAARDTVAAALERGAHTFIADVRSARRICAAAWNARHGGEP